MKPSRSVLYFLFFLAVQLPAQDLHPLRVDDLFALKNVGDPQVSPEGKWVADTVSAMDAKEDGSDTDIYMAPFSGGTALRLTGGKKAETSPRWIPDGRYLALLSAREGNKTQVWLLDRTGGEASKVENIVTPTLILCGQSDMNVPLLDSEQLYQALRRLGRETGLVIYPGQSHGIRTPSYQKDRYERYLAWYGRPLGVPVPALSGASQGQKPEAVSLLGLPLYSQSPGGAAGKQLEDDLAKATADFVKDPDSADNIIWLGRRLAYAGRFREAIDVYSRGIGKFPRDFRILRHRGHRYITLREFDRAVADLEKATELIRGVPDQVEPAGAPAAPNAPPSTSHFNIWYHLGLAYYLKGDFENALRSYRECMKFSGDDDRRVATSDWLYMTLRRMGRNQEAARVLEPITPDMNVVENTAYHDRLLMYKGLKKPEELLGNRGDSTALATYGYGVANWYYYSGQVARAKDLFQKVVQGTGWAAFGYIATEADLARLK